MGSNKPDPGQQAVVRWVGHERASLALLAWDNCWVNAVYLRGSSGVRAMRMYLILLPMLPIDSPVNEFIAYRGFESPSLRQEFESP